MITIENDKEQCKGKIYRADVQHCQTKRGILFSVRLNEIKRLSCQGCDKCGWIDENLSELNDEWGIVNICEAEHGKLYTIDMCNERKDWETGIVTDWDLKIVEYKK